MHYSFSILCCKNTAINEKHSQKYLYKTEIAPQKELAHLPNNERYLTARQFIKQYDLNELNC